MTITTQDGRRLTIDRNVHLHISGSVHAAGKLEGKKCKITLTTFTKIIKHFSDGSTYETGGELLERLGVVGEFNTTTCLSNALYALQHAWNDGANYFIMPLDANETDSAEAFDNFCDEHHLTCVSINELGYSPQDTARNIHLWHTTNDFECRNILIADSNADRNDFGGVYSTSFKKWQALQERSIAS